MPTPDYLQYVQPLEAIGKDDAWIAQALEGVCPSNIDATALYEFASENDLWLNTPDGISGALQTAWNDPNNGTPPLTKKVLGVLFSAIFDPASTKIWTTIEPRRNGTPKGVQFCRNLYLTLGRLLTNADITQGNIDDLYDLAGGRSFAGIVEADIVASRDAYNAQVAADAAQDAADAAEQARVEGIQALRAEIGNHPTFGLNQFEADGVTDAATARAAVKAGL